MIFDSFFVQIGICPFLFIYVSPLLLLLLCPSPHLYETNEGATTSSSPLSPLLLTPPHTHYWQPTHISISPPLTRQTNGPDSRTHTHTHSDSQTRPFLGADPPIASFDFKPSLHTLTPPPVIQSGSNHHNTPLLIFLLLCLTQTPLSPPSLLLSRQRLPRCLFS